MGKKRRKQRPKRPTNLSRDRLKRQAAPELSPEDRQVAVGRMAGAFAALSAPPEGIIPLLDRLEIPWEVRELDDLAVDSADSVDDSECDSGDHRASYLVVRVASLEEGEARNQAQGSILDRMGYNGIEAKPRNIQTVTPVRPDMSEVYKAAEKWREAMQGVVHEMETDTLVDTDGQIVAEDCPWPENSAYMTVDADKLPEEIWKKVSEE